MTNVSNTFPDERTVRCGMFNSIDINSGIGVNNKPLIVKAICITKQLAITQIELGGSSTFERPPTGASWRDLVEPGRLSVVLPLVCITTLIVPPTRRVESNVAQQLLFKL